MQPSTSSKGRKGLTECSEKYKLWVPAEMCGAVDSERNIKDKTRYTS